MKKVISVLLTVLMLLSVSVTLVGAEVDEYGFPVETVQYTETAPKIDGDPTPDKAYQTHITINTPLESEAAGYVEGEIACVLSLAWKDSTLFVHAYVTDITIVDDTEAAVGKRDRLSFYFDLLKEEEAYGHNTCTVKPALPLSSLDNFDMCPINEKAGYEFGDVEKFRESTLYGCTYNKDEGWYCMEFAFDFSKLDASIQYDDGTKIGMEVLVNDHHEAGAGRVLALCWADPTNLAYKDINCLGTLILAGKNPDATEAPTDAPTEAPTAAPTEAPTAAPTEAPTAAPTVAETAAPIEGEGTAPEATEPAEGGCASAMGGVAVVVAAMVAAVALKKRH